MTTSSEYVVLDIVRVALSWARDPQVPVEFIDILWERFLIKPKWPPKEKSS